MVPKILQLLGSDARAEATVRAELLGTAARLHISGPIGWYGVTAEAVHAALAEIGARDVDVWINSPGGDVFAARDMHTALKAHAGRVTATVAGLAASAASFLMLAAEEIAIAPGAFVMIHNPWTFAIADAAGLRKTADLLDQVRDVIAEDYRRKSGKAIADVVAAMDAETWLAGKAAVAWGLCDRLTEEDEAEGEDVEDADEEDEEVEAAAAARLFNLSAYDRVPKALKAPPPAPQTDPAAAMKALHAQALRRLDFYDRIRA
jgi:ATP-dependent Clp protease, protease subunit